MTKIGIQRKSSSRNANNGTMYQRFVTFVAIVGMLFTLAVFFATALLRGNLNSRSNQR